MSLEKLIASLQKDIETREKAIIGEAEETAARIISEAEARSREAETEAERLEAGFREKSERIGESRSRLDVKRAVARAENRLAEELKSKCREIYREFMNAAGYRDFVMREIDKALQEIPDMEKIAADPVTAAALRENDALSLMVTTDENIVDGFSVSSKGGRKRIVSVFDSRFDKAWREHCVRFMKIISDKV